MKRVGDQARWPAALLRAGLVGVVCNCNFGTGGQGTLCDVGRGSTQRGIGCGRLEANKLGCGGGGGSEQQRGGGDFEGVEEGHIYNTVLV